MCTSTTIALASALKGMAQRKLSININYSPKAYQLYCDDYTVTDSHVLVRSKNVDRTVDFTLIPLDQINEVTWTEPL